MAEQFHFDPDTYLEMVRKEVPDYDEFQAAVADCVAAVPAANLLELGTGTGETLRRVAGHHPSAQLIGIDESARMLAAARTLVPAADLRVARLQDPLPDGPFDVVFSALAVHHLDAGEKAALFRDVAYRLAPGGRFVLGDVVVPDDLDDVVTPLDEGYDRPSRADEQLQWLGAAGFRASVQWARRDLAVLVGDLER